MRHLRLPMLTLLTALLLLSSLPATAMTAERGTASATAESATATAGWMGHLLARLLDDLPWDLAVAAVGDESANGTVPLGTDAPDDPTVQAASGPEDSSESGALIDPNG